MLNVLVKPKLWWTLSLFLVWAGSLVLLWWTGQTLWQILLLVIVSGASALLASAAVHWSLIRWLVYVSRQLDRTPPGAKMWFNEAQRDYVKWAKPDDPSKWH